MPQFADLSGVALIGFLSNFWFAEEIKSITKDKSKRLLQKTN
jgi:hypothetical protein